MNQIDDSSWKYWLMKFSLILSLGIIFISIFRLSVIKGNYYKNLATENKLMEQNIPAARAMILDRKGRVVAKSVYQYFKLEGSNKIYEGAGDFQGYKFEGRDLAFDLKRLYPYEESMSFITGYVGKINQDDQNLNKCGVKLDNSNVVGRSGVESFLDCQLRGVDGRRLVEVDAMGKYVRELGRQEPKVPEDLNLSIDAYWQDKIYKLLDGKKAVVIISEPKTGKIISLVSSPAFNPNDFSYDPDQNKIKEYLNDNQNLPLMNRSISGRYSPGSVFKMVVATAGLESGVIDRNSLIEDTGVVKVGDYSYSNWLWSKSGSTDGMVDVIKAIKRSNDIFFYKLGEMLGLNRIKEWADKYGYGKKTGIELTGELDGIVPDEKWKKEVKGEGWFLGNTYHLSIGQGDLSVTPLQVNQMTNIVANKGIKCKMSILKDSKVECSDLGIKKDNWKIVVEGMKEACKTGGTAWPLFNFKTEIACKTGTAEVGDGSKDTHAWLTAFAPADDPQISITVLVERGGEGSDVAAPIVGDILKEWFEEPETVVLRKADKNVISE
ncbi:MAG: penicillin-binding transpeptidase domain-containing protein [Candidatus Shapirobacteria bacterium]|jgi:penicillin-binding protein 2|nr:penicillin-binding transpeptidase domain-containing protein [Candidatus Shapirobacteria bacterium]